MSHRPLRPAPSGREPSRDRGPRALRSPLIALTSLLALVVALLVASPPGAQAAPFRVLVYSEVTNFTHDSIPAGIAAVKKLGAENGFEVEATDDSAVFNDTDLSRFQAVVFNNTNSTPEKGDLLTAAERAALQKYIRAGGGWVGLHAASASERDWDWYEGLVGAIFDQHPAVQTGRVKVLDHAHPSTKDLPELWERTEEWYNWRSNPTSKVHTLAQIKVRDGITGLDEGVDHPWSWCQNYDGGRSWFTAGGHAASAFQEEGFVKHLLGGIQWAAGAEQGDCTATRTGSFQRTALATDDLADPFELAVAPDRRVFFAQRTGKLKVIDQQTMKVSTALDLAYTPEMTSQSDGLLGLALDPGFARNNWLYLLHSDKSEKRLNLSRFTVIGNTVDTASEKRLLTIPTLRGEGRANSHMAGSLAFDKNGNLYAATGDNTDPFASDGFTPIDEGEGRRAWDAQGTAGNTNDLRGKVLRITPQDDGTYTVPEDNLFAPGTQKTRPEIYAMGMRNPFRITTDPVNGALMVADYGPDARSAVADRGPEGTVEYTRITEAGNFGWPYCVGDNTPFNDYDFTTKKSGAKFDCAALVNDSPNNTGLRELPPAQPATVWYAYSASPEFPELGTGGGGPMSGPVYDYDPANTYRTKFPEYFEGKWLNYELTRRWFKTFSFQQKDQTFTDPRFAPARAGDLQSVNGIFEDMAWNQPFDADFGPDGALYVIDFGLGSGTGRGGSNEGAGIYRIDYVGDGRLPDAKVSTDRDSGPAPLTVAFSSAGSGLPDGQPVSYAWDFDGNGTTDSTEANPSYTYRTKGLFTARLTVTGPGELTALAVRDITVGNTRPEVTIQRPPNGGMFSFGDTIPFTVKVKDREDGRSGPIDCSRVVVQSQLGHDTHLHPLDNYTGCAGEIVTDAGDSHGPGQNLYYGITAQYEDEGAPGAPALTGSTSLTLRTTFREAEHFTATGGTHDGVVVGGRADASGGKRLTEIEDGDWIAFDPVNLKGIGSVTVGAASGGIGGSVEFRAGSPTGPLLGTVNVPNTGDWGKVVSPTTALKNPGGSTKLYAVFSNPEWSGEKADLFAVDWLRFNGPGVEKRPGTKVTVKAAPATGTAPLTVALSGAVVPVAGREIASYHWDFGDNTAPSGTEGASATHTYGRKGAYTAHLTVTDDKGDTSTGSVRVDVK
ncbi:ThuA domain-containing protein [Streptomyces sp. NBC_01433]|uniref:ThuA domain-containing protein n=1 Tax=Streptomyces sp. NBC_01433 TaxID=2903864 RepID=UPI002255556E|nr:ThuA domain-containing protein [Streptomyces sp. NBC_01433]MCX4679961.1 ThuA domain-containing protein [Streptomyces sp. NBC_01433]